MANMRRRDGFYRLTVDGTEQKFVSVTTVLSSLNKPALVRWAAKTAAELVLEDPFEFNTADKAASGIYGARDAAANRGQTVHSAIEALLYGAPLDVAAIPDAFRGYVESWQKWAKLHKPVPTFAEATVYNTAHKYAGTTDFIGFLGGNTDELWMLDWKTSKDAYRENGLQLAAYRYCDLVLPRTQSCDDCGGIGCDKCGGFGRVQPRLASLPTIDRTGIILLREDGRQAELRPFDEPLEPFLALKQVWEWSRGG